MRVLLVADLHGIERHYRFVADEVRRNAYDALAIAGDLLDLSQYPRMRDQLRLVRTIVNGLPQQLSVFLCSGNHDAMPSDPYLERAQWLRELRRRNVYVDGDATSIGAHSVECVGWGHIPAGEPDLIVCHSPPSVARTAVAPDGEYGDPDIADHLRSAGRGIVLCGHVHAASSWYDLRDGMWSLNPCQDTSASEPAYIVIDLAAGTAARGGQMIRLNFGH